jgi:hypothetical protein
MPSICAAQVARSGQQRSYVAALAEISFHSVRLLRRPDRRILPLLPFRTRDEFSSREAKHSVWLSGVDLTSEKRGFPAEVMEGAAVGTVVTTGFRC